MMETNIQTIQKGYAEFGSGNIEAVVDLMHDDITWTDPGYPAIPHSGIRKGKNEAGKFFGEMAGNISFTRFEPQQFLQDGNYVTVKGFFAGKANATGKTFESDWIMLWELADGKIKSYQSFFDTHQMAAALI
jgi:ketosteroid isomerase-like protein